jgi:anti-anti-sigma factor
MTQPRDARGRVHRRRWNRVPRTEIRRLQEQRVLVVDLRTGDGVNTVTVTGEIDMATASTLRASLEGLSGAIVLDLRQTTFLGSTAIALFVDTQKRLTAERERLRIRSPHKFPRRVLKIAGLEGWIES